ncbi:MAG TPA: bifunctional glutamate N-acetyltransferase/amino-acid acetyltransferase ArgJ [Gammaproteobacteria bacterium]|nr:bifunctional glutamate N-acetyltransferase/amino-acid acetyltransferase ArgJ [Gammaproteobacteria bacterium]
MSVGKQPLPVMHAVPGLRLAATCAGIKQEGRRDVVLMALDEGTQVAAVFTRNAFCAAPVHICRAHLSQSAPRYLLTNTGNANAGTGEQGVRDGLACCEAVAQAAGCATAAVLPFSTGVIGEPLPVEKITTAVPALLAALGDDGWADAAHGILTTDTVPKGVSMQVSIDGVLVTVTGIAKGSGMIRPDMATLLAYIATDAQVAQPVLQACLEQAVARSFNRITVDGDTSTNDSCLLMATGRSALRIGQADGSAFEALCTAVSEVCESLAQAMVRDGEGATKLMTIDVQGGLNSEECLLVAYAIAHSPLVKTAFFAADPNWGRILAVVGRAGLKNLDINAVQLFLDDVCIVRDGGRASEYTEEAGQAVMDRDEINICVVLGRGEACEQVWSCDLSYDYVRINAEYRT